jgi:hypothetical protein
MSPTNEICRSYLLLLSRSFEDKLPAGIDAYQLAVKSIALDRNGKWRLT